MATIEQRTMPIAVGNAKATAAHFQLPVSFRMVKSVVEHGQWKMENNNVHSAVVPVQPFARKS